MLRVLKVPDQYSTEQIVRLRALITEYLLPAHSHLCINCQCLWPDKTRLPSNALGKRQISRSPSLSCSMMSVKRISVSKTQRAVTRPVAFSSNDAETAPNERSITPKFAAHALLWPPLPLLLSSIASQYIIQQCIHDGYCMDAFTKHLPCYRRYFLRYLFLTLSHFHICATVHENRCCNAVWLASL